MLEQKFLKNGNIVVTEISREFSVAKRDFRLNALELRPDCYVHATLVEGARGHNVDVYSRILLTETLCGYDLYSLQCP